MLSYLLQVVREKSVVLIMNCELDERDILSRIFSSN